MKSRFVWLILALLMLSFVGATTAPAIVNQPQSVTVVVGMPVMFEVTTTGDDVVYQWVKNSEAIAGQTNRTLVLPPATLADNGSVYSVTAKNDKGSVTSCFATLTVIENGTPSQSAPTCQQGGGTTGGSGGGGGGGGGGCGGGDSSASSSSTSSSGNPTPNNPPPNNDDMNRPYPLTRWKGPVKATFRDYDNVTGRNLTTVIEGDITWESSQFSFGRFPTSITAVGGSLTLRTSGNIGPGCTKGEMAAGTVKPGEGAISFIPDPPLPQQATQLKYGGSGASTLPGQITTSCPASTVDVEHHARWFEADLSKSEFTTSVDLLTITGTFTDNSPGFDRSWEWSLTKQP